MFPFLLSQKCYLEKVHTFRLHKCRNTRCSNSRNKGITFLINVDAMMPTSPWLGRGKHASTSAHITERTLTRTVSTTTTYTRYTCHSSSSTPWFSRGLMTYEREKKLYLILQIHVIKCQILYIYLPASLETQYGCLLFVEINWWTTLTMSGRIGALKTDGREITSPDASFLSVYTVIIGRAVDNDWKKVMLHIIIQIY